MQRKKKDWVALIEAGYSLDGTDQKWLENVLEKTAPLFDRGRWPGIATFRFTATTVDIDHVTVHGPSCIAKCLRDSARDSSKAVDLVFRSNAIIASMSELVFSRFPGERDNFRQKSSGIMRDTLGVKAHTGTGSGLIIFQAFMRKITPTPMERKRWPLMVSHLGAGLRLRSVTRKFSFDNAPVEAILDPGGKVHDASNVAVKRSARESLRNAVLSRERMLTRAGRSDPDEAMSAWKGLVQGRWSLVDRFDTDQRRYVVAVRNDPTHPDPRGLTDHERQVSEYVGLGRSSKEISYILGVSSSAVTNCTARVQTKLGLSSRTELTAFFAPGGLRAKLAEVSIAGEKLLVGAYPLINEKQVLPLTDAERSILAHLLAGSTNNDIAQRRNTSDRTVANQVQSIFDKLQVRSRSELAARLQNAA